ncbi:hypothetical protein CSB45_16325 [candidate division KSB3 bacterium]|uniref:Prepilin-type cleavage/methylation domain-containing protein n=1 Tax=candidate division KSB3 bacterium TaxID=2044937 RepID=A0A2G6DZJ9_9BACT|nr:MAG: hypothetical protein CSB45_16325 [candidate division KSB3 bacterium]
MKSNSKGFTLIEMAIVLVIIGLILGAVTKGKDMVESARQKKFYNSVIRGWQLAFINYTDRTGLMLADARNDTNAKTESTSSRDNRISGNIANAIAQLEAVGFEPPTSSPFVSFGNRTISLSLGYTGGKNWMGCNAIPKKLAIALDTIIDGEMDQDNGSVTYTVSESGTVTGFTVDVGTL